jgi:hypothetical protein
MTAAIEVASKAAVKIVVNAVSGGGSGGGVTAHSALTGLTTGDDHTQYQRSESVFTAAASYTVTSETTIVSTGSTVVLPSAQAKAGRSVLVGAGANLTVNTSGTDIFIDGSSGTTFAIQTGNGVGFTAINVGGAWGWAIVTRQGSSYDLPVWVGQSLAAGKVLRIDGTGAPAWASIAAGDMPAATTSAAGSMSAADKSKLNGVATGATANATDADLRDRATHTGTQAVGTITGLATIATSGSATDLSAGTVPSARLASKAVGGLGTGSGVAITATAASILSSTITLPACAAGDVLMVEGSFTINNNSTAARTYTGVLKLGATSILTFTLGSQAVATRVHAFQAYIRVNTTTSQSASANLVHNTVAGTSGVAVSCSGVATETISSALALDLTLASSTGTLTQTGTLEHITVTRIAA